MLPRCNNGRGCGGVEDATEEKDCGYEHQEKHETNLDEAPGTSVDCELHAQQYMP